MTNSKHEAGKKQESQVSYQLQRHLGNDPQYRVLDDLKFSVDGYNSQIDHLVIFRTGFVVIESKSVHGSVRVNEHEEWERSYKNNWYGIPSPIQQAAVQINALKDILNLNRKTLLPNRILGLEQRFGGREYHCVIAVSSSARLERDQISKGVSESIVKTEFLIDHIKALTRNGSSLIRRVASSQPGFTDDDMDRMYHLLKTFEQDAPENYAPQQQTAHDSSNAKRLESEKQQIKSEGNAEAAFDIKCKKCGASEGLTAKSGRYGYYAHCSNCTGNTALKFPCPTCESTKTRARKAKARVFLECENCQTHTNLTIK